MPAASRALVRPEAGVGERSEPAPAGGGIKADRQIEVPNPEVPEKAKRRTFTAQYKRSILRETERCAPGEVGAVLRREGLYSSHLTQWRAQRDAGELQGLAPQKRGRRRKERKVSAKEADALRRENACLKRKLKQAEIVIDIQKKASEILGIPLRHPDDEGND